MSQASILLTQLDPQGTYFLNCLRTAQVGVLFARLHGYPYTEFCNGTPPPPIWYPALPELPAKADEVSASYLTYLPASSTLVKSSVELKSLHTDI